MDIRIKQKTTKLCFFTSNKDKTPPLSRSNVVYEFTCPGCNSSYIGKTNRTLLVRTQEHALTDKESAIYKHLHYCDQIKHIQGLYSSPDVFVNENNPPSIAMNKEFLTQTVRGNTNIIDSDDNWNLLLYKEAYHMGEQGWRRDGAVVRALASHQCGPGSIPGLGVICGLSLLLVLVLAPRGFSPGTPVFPSPQKSTFLNSNSIWKVSPISAVRAKYI